MDEWEETDRRKRRGKKNATSRMDVCRAMLQRDAMP